MSSASDPVNDYIHDPVQFIIDSDLRVISVDERGVIAGVVGDKNVNRINFHMPRYYNGFDMSTFETRINYINPAGQSNFYHVGDMTIDGDLIYFTWLLESDVTAYVGNVLFVVRMVKTENDVITQCLYTAINDKMRVLEGIQVDDAITVEEQRDILASMTAALSLEKDKLIAEMNTDTNIAQIKNNQDAIQALQTELEGTSMDLLSKVDGGYVEDGCLYLTAGEDVVVGPLGPFASSGGGGGGSGSGNNAVISLSNTSGWLSTTISQNGNCRISGTWSSLEDGISTGVGTLTVKFNGVTKINKTIEQGEFFVDVPEYLVIGTNKIKVTVTDIYGNNRTINFSVTVVDLSISSSFDSSSRYSDSILFSYTPTGALEKTVHFIVDDTEIATVTTSASGRQLSYVIPKQTHGRHKLKVYFTATVNGSEVSSNILYYEIACVEDGNKTPIVTSDFNQNEFQQYTSIPLTYRVYNPDGLETNIQLYVNDVLYKSITVDRTEQTWTYRADAVGALKLKIVATNDYDSSYEEWTFNITQSDVTVSAETEALSLYLSAYGRSNNEENPAVWTYNDISCTFNNFNFVSDGWQLDDDKVSVLRVSGNARLEIPVQIFKDDFRSTGKTIEFEFATRDVMDYDAVIISCLSGNRGIQLSANELLLQSAQSKISTMYKENEHVRISFVIEKRSENRLIYCYINGVMSRVVQYPTSDDFSQQTPVNISVGSNDCAIDLYCIRIYENDLTRIQILNNWIADCQDVEQMLARNARNDIYDEYGSIVIDKLPKNVPYFVAVAPQLPTYKGDKKTISGYFVNQLDESKSFTFEGASADVQGTSSAGYARKNFKIKFKGGFVINGVQYAVYAMIGEDNCIPTSTFTFKADVASSEGCNNVELVRLYCDICPYKTPPQLVDSRIRQGIDGFPMLMFQDDGSGPKFIGKYNFNNDKGTEEVYGFSEGDESWEQLNNTSSRSLWKSDDFSNDDWKNDFEGRYPDKNTDITNLHELSKWIVSTDTTAATNAALPQSVVYDGVTYTNDTAEYRLAKFKNEFTTIFDKDSTLFYYLFTELFLMVDSRTKNAFPTFFNGHKWIWLPYDMDTAMGINNEGALVFDYSLEDIDKVNGANVFNGQDSVMWVNVRKCFFDDIAKMYRELRAEGTLSYESVEKRFEDHQAVWSEAVFNEDAWYKYLEPLIKNGEAAYLSMLLGPKSEQRKWWLYNRFRYMDSKYNAGDALADFIMLRAYSKQDITVTPYADIYAGVKYGSYLVTKRALRGSSYTLECPLDSFNDTEIFIYSAPQLKTVGDLSGLLVGYADFSKAKNLQVLKLGDSASSYSNPNLAELYLGNNKLIRIIDVRNCVNLTQTPDLSGCSNVEEVYFDGTAITGIELPKGGIIKKLHLPATVTNLTIINQNGINEFVMPSYVNITTLVLENVSNTIDELTILNSIADNSRVRLIGFDWSYNTYEDCRVTFDKLDRMRGIDENGNNTDIAELSGVIRIPTVTGAQVAEIRNRYPSVKVIYEHISSYCHFWNEDGTQLLQTVQCLDGGDAVYSGTTPTKSSTAQYNYDFAGWSFSPGGTANSNALKNVTADRTVYAAFSATIRTYTVYFYNGSELLQTDTNVPYGGTVVFYGVTPVHPEGPENYEFIGWSPDPSIGITGNTSYYAQYKDLRGPRLTSDWRGSINKNKINSLNIIKDYTTDSYDIKYDAGSGLTGYATLNESYYDIILTWTGEYEKVKMDDSASFYYCVNLVDLDLSMVDTSECTSMQNLFAYCNKLTNLNISSFDTSNVTNMEGMFQEIYNLKSLDLSHFDTSKVKYMISMFDGSTGLTSLNLSNWNTDSVTNMSRMFHWCSGLISLDLSSFNTSNVVNMTEMFNGCTGLTSLDVSSFNASNVVDMSYMFTSCEKLTSINVSNFNTLKATDMRYMFSSCKALTSLDLSSFNTSNVTSMTYMFNYCTALTSLNLSNFVTTNVKNMSYMFYGCAKITALDLSSFETTNVTNMSYMFKGCKVLASLDVSSFNTSNVTNMTEMFASCKALTSLDVSSFVNSKVTNMNGMFRECEGLTILNLSNFVTTNVTNMSYMFYYCKALTSLDLSSFVTTNVKNMSYMFDDCSALASLNVTNFDTQNVTSMSSMFYGCGKITALDLSSFNTSKVTSMTNMFKGCTGLTILNLTNFVTTNVTGMGGMFEGCSGLTSLNLSSFNTSNVKTMTNMFYGCGELTSLDLSNFVTTNVTTMNSMFYGCGKITALDLSNFDTSKVTNDGMINMFYGCSGLTSLNLSNFNTYSITKFDGMFYGCSGLTSLNLSNWNTSKVYSMHEMFYNCSSLLVLDLTSFNTAGVTDMGYMCNNCNSLTAILIGQDTDTAPQKLLSGHRIPTVTPVYVPDALVDAYKAVQLWSAFTNILPRSTYQASA